MLALVISPVVAASLMVASPSTALAAGAPDAPDTTSVDVSNVDASSTDANGATVKSDPLPDPKWPTAGDSADVPVGTGDTTSADPDQPTATTDDPDGAPSTLTVTAVGQLPEGNPAGLGAGYIINAPTDGTSSGDTSGDTGSGGDQTVPPLLPPSSSDSATGPAVFRRALTTSALTANALHADDETPATPAPTMPSPTETTPTTPDQSTPTTPTAPEPTDPPTTDAPTPDDPQAEPPAFTSDVDVDLSYADYAGAYGGDWASRLHAVQLNGCTTTDGQISCLSTTPLKSVNNTADQTVTVTVPADTYSTATSADQDQTPGDGGSASANAATDSSSTGSVVALTAGSSGDRGSFAASPMTLGGSWSAGGQSGDFDWSYPIASSPVDGPSPNLALTYSSGSVDGMTESTNNQGSRIGTGFELDPGYVERSYIPCKDDIYNSSSNAPDGSSELCWDTDNLTISLNGKTEEVEATGNGDYRMLSDDGTTIQHVIGSDGQNQAHENEFWVATTTDGTKYYFGRNKRFANDPNPTSSVSTVRVYGNNFGEPCHEYAFADSGCTQAWRWSLDYVVDPHGNTMSLYYTQEDNEYGALPDSSDHGTVRSTYDRAVRLDAIYYGNTQARDQAGSPAPYKISIDKDGRCINTQSACDIADLDSDSANTWPDVPYDRLCYASTDIDKCPTTPSFFSLYRVKSITTSYLYGGNYVTNDVYTLHQTYPDSGDSSSRSMWLSSIDHTSGTGADQVTWPTTSFTGVQMANRVDTTGDKIAPFTKYRIAAINNGAGGLTNVNYTDDTKGGSTATTSTSCSYYSGQYSSTQYRPAPAALDANHRLCYPSWYTPDYADEDADPQMELFHKYVVRSVVQSDQRTNEPAVTTRYTYEGDPAWHFTRTNLVERKYRTWDDWRGFSKVITQTGSGSDKSWQEDVYMRGMDGDVAADETSTNSYTIADSYATTTIDDSPGLEGFLRRTLTRNGEGGSDVAYTVNTPWRQKTADTAFDDAYMVNTATSVTTTPVVGTTHPQVDQTDTTYDAHGRPTAALASFTDGGSTAVTDKQCTKTTYADPAVGQNYARSEVATQITTAGDCSTAPASAGDVIGATRTYYDGDTDGSGTLTKGDATSTWAAGDGISSGQVTFASTPDARNTYDDAGRILTAKDALGNTTTTAYALVENAVNSDTVTNAKGQVTTTGYDRRWHAPVIVTAHKNSASTSPSEVDKVTTYDYDGAGRVTSVNVPGDKADKPSYLFSYAFASSGGDTRTATQTLNANGTYTLSKTFYDGLMRERETQSEAAGPDGGRLITENFYDDHGNLESDRGPYYNENPISTSVEHAPASSIPSYTDYTYDDSGRQTVATLMSYAKKISATTTGYGGDYTDVTPPTGGTATRTTTDAHGRTVSLMQFHGATPTGTADTTAYAYTPAGQLQTLTNSMGTHWTWDYNIRGQQVTAHDPDAGTTTTKYDLDGRAVATEDANGHWLWTTYDELGRKTELRDGTSDGPTSAGSALRSSWTYDSVQTGELSSSVRHTSDGDYVESVNTYDAAGRPTQTTLQIPGTVELGDLHKTDGYVITESYFPDGSPRQVVEPSTSGTGVMNEAINYTYDDLGNPLTMTGAGAYVAATTYTPYSQVGQRVLGPTIGKAVYDTRTYDDATSRLTEKAVTTQTASHQAVMDLNYAYDASGNITSLNDYARTSTGAVDEASSFEQCFSYDYLQRLTTAWTATGQSTATGTGTNAPCAATPSAGGSVDAYLETFGYDDAGDRTAWTTQYGSSAAPTTHYQATYPAASASQPHAVTSVSDGSATQYYGYDADGHTTTRKATSTASAGSSDCTSTSPAGSSGQAIAWDCEGHESVVKNTATGKTTSYVYDADGNRLVKKDQAADTITLYVGDSEYTLHAGSLGLTRTYTLGGETIATRSTAGVQILDGDQNNNATIAIDATSLAVTHRRFDPFGQALDTTAPAWPSDKGYLGKTTDTDTGTTHLDAREYDPSIGRFISVDPKLDSSDPQSLNGYAYADNSPVIKTDGTGENACDQPGHCGATGNLNSAYSGDHSSPSPAPSSSSGGGFGSTASKMAKNSLSYQYQQALGGIHSLGWLADLPFKSYGVDFVPQKYKPSSLLDDALKKAGAGGTGYESGVVEGNILQIVLPGIGEEGALAKTLTIGTGEGIGVGTAEGGSRLAEVSKSAFRAAADIDNFSVSAKHLPGAAGRYNKWAEGVDINRTIASALKSDGATFLPNTGGTVDSFIVRTNVGRVIGTKGQTVVKAVVSNGGRIITAYPVK